ncbi:MAG: phosphotransferase family protein [Sphingomonadales bacterium]|nr:phosphotransferase family protein [Sphingomonadales bacterium]MBU3994087.1 phosphotransferase family protein [Alphaproteobacteria bacterium]
MTLDTFDGLLNWENLQAWIAANDLPGSGPVDSVTPILGGSQNALFMLTRGSERLVLRRPPKHLRPNNNETMRREARLLKGLAGTDVPHAELYGACDDESVIGATFYIMEPLDGFSPMHQLPGQYATDASWRREMGAEMVRAAAALSKVDYVANGLADYGKPDNWHGRQVERWRSQLESYQTMENYPGQSLPLVDETGRWLTDNMPSDGRVGLIHGDFQYPNVMYFDDRPKISGLIDWELSTLGDPLLDLGWMLSSWSGEGDPEGKTPVVTPWDGFLTRAELVTLYGELTGRDMSAMPWFAVLGCYKLACILEGSYARACAGKMPKELGESLHKYALWLMVRAQQIIGRGKV